MKFIVSDEIFAKLPEMIVGVVVAHEIDNTKDYPQITAMLDQQVAAAQARFKDAKVKERPEIIPYREAFRTLGINPNRFPCSAEALFKRLAKGKDLPHINPLVDLNNAISLQYTVPMGTHTLDGVSEDVMMRPAVAGDQFVPLGKTAVEEPEAGEVVYAVGHQVRTRRWTWRQSEYGKIGPQTHSVFFPLDGFASTNRNAVLQARAALASRLEEIFGVTVQTGLVDQAHPAFKWE